MAVQKLFFLNLPRFDRVRHTVKYLTVLLSTTTAKLIFLFSYQIVCIHNQDALVVLQCLHVALIDDYNDVKIIKIG